MENNEHVELVPKFATEAQEDKGPFDQIGVVKLLNIDQLTQSNSPRWHVEDVSTVSSVKVAVSATIQATIGGRS